MRRQYQLETEDERDERLKREAKARRADVAADDAAIDRMVRRNIEQFGA